MRKFDIIKSLVLIIMACMLYGCHDSKVNAPDLLLAEELMEEHPDSALTLLKQIPDSFYTKGQEQALYCLLLTEAMDKTFATHTTDSLIAIAVQYYDHTKDLSNKAKAWYYLGRVSQDLLHRDKALECYLKAIPYAKDAKDYRQLIMIYNYMGTLYRQQKIYGKALEVAIKSKEYCVLLNDTNRMSYALRNIGRIYLFQERSDSTFYYYTQALQFAEDCKNKVAKGSILNELGACYRQIGKYDKAIESIQSSIPLKKPNKRSSSYLSLARLYFELNQFDSVGYYLNEAQRNPSLHIQEGVYQYKYQLAKAQKEYEKAVKYNDHYQVLKDSISKVDKSREMLILTYNYDYKELKSKLENEAYHERLVYICFIFLLLAVTSVGGYVYIRYRWKHEQILRLQEKRIRQEKELRQQSLEQIRLNKQQIQTNELKLKSKEEDLQNAERKLLVYNTKLLNVENELIKLRREEQIFKNRLFFQTGLGERIKCAGVDPRKKDFKETPFTLKEDYLNLVKYLNEYYDDFVNRLGDTYPNLKEQDIKICCLIKAGAKTGNISSIISMTPNAVTKKKGQILKKMEIVDKSATLDHVLEMF